MVIFIYMILGYWAVGKTIYKNRVLIGTASGIFLRKVTIGFLLGWILIPIAIVLALTARR
jgi:hypothetical protein